jgi:hypothetical protein
MLPFLEQADQKYQDKHAPIFSFMPSGYSSDAEVYLVVLLLVNYSMTVQDGVREVEEMVSQVIDACGDIVGENRFHPCQLGPWTPPNTISWKGNTHTIRDVVSSTITRTKDQLSEPVVRAFLDVTGCGINRAKLYKWKNSLIAPRQSQEPKPFLVKSSCPRTQTTRLSHMMPAVAFRYRRDKDECMKLLEQKIDACETEKSLVHDAPTSSPQKATLKRLLLEKNEAVATLEMQVEDREETIIGLEVCFKCVVCKIIKKYY